MNKEEAMDIVKNIVSLKDEVKGICLDYDEVEALEILLQQASLVDTIREKLKELKNRLENDNICLDSYEIEVVEILEILEGN